MPGTRTAPTVNGSPSFTNITVRFIDYTGDTTAYAIKSIGGTVTNAEIEAHVAAIVAGSNASVYEVWVQQAYTGAKQASNALEDVYENVASHITILAKNVAIDKGQNIVVPAPLDTLLVDGTNTPDAAALGTVITTGLTVLDGGAAGSPGSYTAIQARFNSTKQINEATPV